MNKEEDYLDDEYIINDNDPFRVEKITKEDDYTIIKDNEEIITHEKIIQSVKTQSDALFYKNDKVMEDKVFDSLKKGLIK